GVFQCFTPATYQYYRMELDRLYASSDRLYNWFPRSVFASITFNLGPWMISWPQTDNHNLTFGWCAITALGNFDPEEGGHLILWDLGLVIRFPPSST
ncbi:hypothetical protein BDP27DRAFT_1142043, partial [Rhodocollybia butyracea]